MRSLSFLSFLVLACSSPTDAQTVTSPDGMIAVTLYLIDGVPSYDVSYGAAAILENSPLGLETTIGSLSRGLAATGLERRSIDERYTLPHGKVRNVHYVASELTVHFRNQEGNQIDVVFRVSDRDVAFAYRLSGPDKRRVTIRSEATGFNLPDNATAFVTQQAKAGTGWMASKPSYEEGYLADAPIDTQSPSGLGFTFPALFRIGEDAWALISETGVSSRYAGTRLTDPTPNGLYRIAFPEPDENGGIGDATVSASLPLLTAWRTITIGSTLAPIVESTVSTDVVEPLYEPSVDYRPGRATWSWLIWQDDSMNEADQRTFIDLADTMGFEYILIDANWDANIGRERIASLVADAHAKGVDAWLWYNTNGAWNDAPQTPRDRMSSAPARQQEMAWLKSIGIKGIKADFFGGDKQTTMKLYEDILTDANAYGLMLNFHGATVPRGWERMYPNHMTSEAIRSSENLVFSQDFADQEALISTLYPFIRNAVGAMDYGPVVLNETFARQPNQGNERRTTDAFQLATAVLFQSPIQHFGLTPDNLDKQPEFVIDFLRNVPTVWDETRYLAGYPGRYIAIARRHGVQWYIAATNSEEVETTLDLTMPFLAGQSITLIHDGEGRAAAAREVMVGSDGRLVLTIRPAGGAVGFGRIVPQ